MTIKTLLASLILGSSTLAAAAPSVTFSASATTGTSYDTAIRDHRTPVVQPISAPAWQGQWKPPVYRQVTLASNLRLATGRAAVSVGAQAGRFNTLQISASSGRSLIKQVYVQFDNGRWQVARNLDQTLAGNQRLTVDLDGNHRAIRQVIVLGNQLGYARRDLTSTISITAA